MLPGEREVGGLWCSEVLTRLDAFAEGELSDADRAQVHAHVAGCSVCERFGQHYAALVARFREHCAAPDPVDAATTERLVSQLVAELGLR